MATLVARDLRLTFGRAVILDGVDLTVAPGHRVGIVAPNGTGKTTLLRVLAGELRPERGSVARTPPSATVGLLPQERDRRPGETGRALVERRTGVAEATAALEQATNDLAAGADGADDRYAEALESWLALGGADLDTRLAAASTRAGLPPELLDHPTTTLSGGEQARLVLVATVLSRFDVLLLDEPTNDLDFAGLDLLEQFVTSAPGGLVLVSHDREFLERTVTSVVEIDEFTKRGTEFGGGFAAYLHDRALARRHAQEAYEEWAAKRADLSDRAKQQRQWAADGVRRAKKDPNENDRLIRAGRIERSEKLASKVRISDKAIERLDREAVEKPRDPWELHLTFGEAPRSGQVVARLSEVVVTRGSFTLGPIDLELAWGERVALVGPNGSGKTTLIDVILGRLAPDAGERYIGPSVVAGELGQSRDRFGSQRSVLDAFVAETAMLPVDARTLLAKFGLGANEVTRPASTLSPGERTRAGLAALMAVGVNLLVLDEPTNHLDLPGIEELERALEAYRGTLLVVSHDRRLLDAVSVDRSVVLGSR